MSIDTMTIRHLQQPKPSEAEEVSVEFRPEIGDVGAFDWSQIDEMLRTSLNSSGFPQPSAGQIRQSYMEMERPPLIVVAEGIAVQAREYEERYDGIDLEYYREHMSPEMFRSFVRRIGSIRGRPDINIGEFANTTEI